MGVSHSETEITEKGHAQARGNSAHHWGLRLGKGSRVLVDRGHIVLTRRGRAYLKLELGVSVFFLRIKDFYSKSPG